MLNRLLTLHGVRGKLRKMVRVAKPARPSYVAEVAYRADLLAVVQVIREVTMTELLPVLQANEHLYAYDVRDSKVRDAWGDDIDKALTSLSRRLGGIDTIAPRIAARFAEKVTRETDKRLAKSIRSAVGIDATSSIAALNITEVVNSAALANAQLIKSIPAQYADRLKNSVLNSVTTGTRYNSIVNDITSMLKVTEDRAKLIARDQTSKLTSSINEAKQTALGITKYVWSTANDERVRDSHSANEGKVFEWDNPPATGHPGEEINCRCVALPYIEISEG